LTLIGLTDGTTGRKAQTERILTSKKQIKELKAVAAHLCPDCTQDCRQRLLILDSQIEALRAEREELRKLRALYEETLNQ